MKVLYLTNIPSPYRVAYFNELGKMCELTVLFEKKGHADRDKSWLDFQVKNFKGIFLNGIKVGTYQTISIDFLKYLKRASYDYIVVTNMSTITGVLAVYWMKMKRIPYCIEGDGGFSGNGEGIKEKIKTSIISTAELCFSTSKIHDEYYRTYGALKDKIYRYPFSSLFEKDIMKKPLTRDEKQKVKKQLGIRERKIILSVGAFIPRKGMDLLIKATSNIEQEWGIYIVGGTPTDEYLQLKDKYHGERLHFVEFLNPEKLKDYFQAADLFVLATREDIWGLVINEAMAYGLPVITTDRCIAGMELIENKKNGFIVKTESVLELKERIEYFVNSTDWIQSYSEESLKIIQNYTIENMVNCHMKIFQRTYLNNEGE